MEQSVQVQRGAEQVAAGCRPGASKQWSSRLWLAVFRAEGLPKGEKETAADTTPPHSL